MVFLEDDRKKIQVSIRNFKKKKKNYFLWKYKDYQLDKYFMTWNSLRRFKSK